MNTSTRLPNDPTRVPGSNTDVIQGRLDDAKQTTIPLVEEELQVGKREVERGGVRVENRVAERPVEETVRLREEHVTVERHPVDRPLTPAQAEAMRGETMEFVEHAEEAVVAKRARVVEEVVVRRDVTNRDETIRDKVRYNVVNVTPLSPTSVTAGARATPSGQGLKYEQYENEFRQNFLAGGYEKKGYQFEDFSPVYRYGHDLASSNTYKGREWTNVENDVRTRWESHNPNTWDHVKEAVRHAWEKVTGA